MFFFFGGFVGELTDWVHDTVESELISIFGVVMVAVVAVVVVIVRPLVFVCLANFEDASASYTRTISLGGLLYCITSQIICRTSVIPRLRHWSVNSD